MAVELKATEVEGIKAMEVDDASTTPKNASFFRKRKYLCCDTKCGCCCCCSATTPLVLIVLFILIAWGQTFPVTKFTNIEYEVNGVTLHAYLATPESPKKGAPAAILFHAWNGVSEDVTFFADELAKQGYYSIAPDLYRGTASKNDNIVWNILATLTTSQNRMDDDSDAALAHLQSIANVDPNKISSGPGFCAGGTQSLIFASRHAVAATVTCYGSYVKELAKDADSSAWGKLKEGGPVLGIFGEDDTRPSPKDANDFGDALVKNKMMHNITIYKGVSHGFIKAKTFQDSAETGHQTNVNAWGQIEQFLAAAFQKIATTPQRALNGNANDGNVPPSLAVVATAPHIVPFRVSLYHRFACAFKCASDHWTKKGHWVQELQQKQLE